MSDRIMWEITTSIPSYSCYENVSVLNRWMLIKILYASIFVAVKHQSSFMKIDWLIDWLVDWLIDWLILFKLKLIE